MKKLLCILALMLTVVCSLASCEMLGMAKPTVGVSDDGYVVVNGAKTEYKVDTADEITVSADGYVVVNGVKTEYQVKKNTHSFGNWKLYNREETDCEYKLYYRTCPDCSAIEWKEGKYDDHDFTTVTTTPTCQAGGYDTKSCELCGKVEICNETPISDHDYNAEYLTDSTLHWQKCKNCDNTTEKVEHALGDDGICTVCNGVIGATEGIIYDLSSDGSYAVIGYSGSAKRIKIASEYNGIPVKEIYREAFKDCSITSVIIPDSVTSIGDWAFYGCSSLSSIVIPDSVTSIGDYAFAYCSSLSSVVIGDSVTSIGDYAFLFCSSLSSIVIPDSVTSIGGAFDGCHSSLYTEEGYVKYVKANDNPYEILIDVTNSNLSSYTIHEDTKHIAGSAFSGCERLSSISIPDSVTSIGNYAFYYCSSLSSIVIPDSVTSIGDYAFYYCSSLSSIVIPDSVTSIGDGAFWNCSSLSSIVIPDSVTSIGGLAFNGCSSLTDVYYTGSAEEWATIEIGDDNYDLTRATIHYNYVPEE